MMSYGVSQQVCSSAYTYVVQETKTSDRVVLISSYVLRQQAYGPRSLALCPTVYIRQQACAAENVWVIQDKEVWYRCPGK